MQPDIQKMMADCDNAVDASFKQQGNWTLGQLIDALEKRAQEQRVIFDFCRVQPGRLVSYRGYYRMLAITPNFAAFHYDNERYNKPITVAELLAELKAAIGATFVGYKGGDFVMSRDTWLWVDEPDQSTGTAVLGLEDDKFETIIRTGHRESAI